MVSANPRAPLLIVGNKADLVTDGDADGGADRLVKQGARADQVAFATSCETGEGLDALRGALSQSLHLSAARGGEALGLHDRQRRHLLDAASALTGAADLLAGADDVCELAAVDLRTALGELAMISGRTVPGAFHAVTEDMLARIFARFCVGK